MQNLCYFYYKPIKVIKSRLPHRLFDKFAVMVYVLDCPRGRISNVNDIKSLEFLRYKESNKDKHKKFQQPIVTLLS